MGNKFETIDDLLSQAYGNTIGNICHYTSFENLLLILKNRTFRLTRFDLLNDKAERELSCCDDGEIRYMMSFTGTTESVAMWAIYGGTSSLKLRVKLSREDLIDSVNNNFFKDCNQQSRIFIDDIYRNFEDYSKKTFSLGDMVYYNQKQNRLRFKSSLLDNIDVTDSVLKKLAGNIKYYPWEFERETRLAVILKQNKSTEDLRHIYAGLNDLLIQKMEITYCPWIEDTVYDKITSCLDEVAGFKLKHKRSVIAGQVDQI
jgi:hypothetical protein